MILARLASPQRRQENQKAVLLHMALVPCALHTRLQCNLKASHCRTDTQRLMGGTATAAAGGFEVTSISQQELRPVRSSSAAGVRCWLAAQRMLECAVTAAGGWPCSKPHEPAGTGRR